MQPLHNRPLCSSTVRSQVVLLFRERIKYSSPSANSNYEVRVIGTVLAKLFIFNSVHKTCPHFLLFCLFVALVREDRRGTQDRLSSYILPFSRRRLIYLDTY
jgi:hypothetical protein